MFKLSILIKNKKNALYILFCYTISFGLITLNKGLFWDDWVWINRDLASFREVGNQMGSLWFQFWAFFAYSNVLLTKCLVFIFNLVTILMFYKIISKHLNKNQSYLLTLFFAIFPN